MRRIACLFILVMSVFTAVPVAAQAVYEPAKGSPERKAILDALRIPVERDLKQKIVFVTGDFNVRGDWAFISGTPTTPAGHKPSLKNTEWEGEEEHFDDNFVALLRKRAGKWRVVAHAIGCTDVCYAEWWRLFKAPKAIFPHTE